MIYSPERDTTTVRRDPGTGLLGTRTCDQCQNTGSLGPKWKKGKVKAGPLRGLNGWICPTCRSANEPR